jgi:hypothetical protein
LALSIAACRRWEAPQFEVETALPNVVLGAVRTYLAAEAEMTFADDIEIVGRVISSDRAGNFYNTFFIDDGTGAAEIMAGMPDLDAVYRPGQRVSVRARGLAVGWRDGAMQIGLPPEPGNRFATGYFYHPAVIRSYITAERDVAAVEPLDVSLSGLDASLCGRLVRIGGLAVDPDFEGTTWASTQPSPATGYVKFRAIAPPPSPVQPTQSVQPAQPTQSTPPAPAAQSVQSVQSMPPAPADSITVVTSGYASFASARVPRGEVALTGILFHGRGEGPRDHFLLKLRDENDIVD